MTLTRSYLLTVSNTFNSIFHWRLNKRKCVTLPKASRKLMKEVCRENMLSTRVSPTSKKVEFIAFIESCMYFLLRLPTLIT